MINHGYLAVDFFFILSGFVVGYAYDDRWKKMGIKNFLKRRLVRLHPMVFISAVIGGVLFYTMESNVWDISQVTVGALIIATLLNALLFPITPGVEFRGFAEMFPLNGPSWSLFFEYIANILYALFMHRLPTKILAIVVIVAGLSLGNVAILGPQGDLNIGYSLTWMQFYGGFSRLLFSFSVGLLLFRLFKPNRIKNSFWMGMVAIIVLLSLPRLGGSDKFWLNGLYDFLCIVVVFPALVYMGTSTVKISESLRRACKFLGDISYPLYMVHYPIFYLYYAWVKNHDYTFLESIWGAVAFVVASFGLAYICLKFYDIPVRRMLTNRFLKPKARYKP